MEKEASADRFQGDFSTMWSLGLCEPLWYMTWDWWWWLVMLDDEHLWGKQLMVLWSTKDNDRVEVNGTTMEAQGQTWGLTTKGAWSWTAWSVLGGLTVNECMNRTSSGPAKSSQ